VFYSSEKKNVFCSTFDWKKHFLLDFLDFLFGFIVSFEKGKFRAKKLLTMCLRSSG